MCMKFNSGMMCILIIRVIVCVNGGYNILMKY